jgi:UDP-2,3-diacylglucosamine pyrophosphatase LpxH
MAIFVSSDWHCGNEKLKPAVVEWVCLGMKGKHHLVGNGDLFDILPLGRKVWEQPSSIEELAALLNGYDFDYIAGNHDPYNIIEQLVAPYPNIKLHRELSLEENGRKYYLAHGHKWAIDWGYLGLRRIAPWVVETVVNIAPEWWYRTCKRLGWLAHESPQGQENEVITQLTRVIWSGASSYALRYQCCVIIGHTHTSGRHEKGISDEIGFKAYMVDCGNLQDGTYVVISKDARLKFLPEYFNKGLPQGINQDSVESA